MRLQTLLALLILPVSGWAQSAKPLHNNELVLQLGTSASLDSYEPAGHSLDWKAPKRASLGLMHNTGPLQYGVQLEAGSESAEHWYVAPSLTGNYRVRYKNGYGYAGVSTGYFLNRNSYKFYYSESDYTQGYQVGVQAGYVRNIGPRFAISGEIAFRQVIRWREQFESYTVSPFLGAHYGGTYVELSRGYQPEAYTMIPVTLGIRYQL